MAFALSLWAAAVSGVDLTRRRVPNVLLLALLVPAAAALALGEGLLQHGWWPSLAGAALALAALLPGYALGQLGAGDVKLGACIGFVIGWRAVPALLLIAALLLGVASLVAWLHARRTGRAATRLPAAPALAVAFVALLAGSANA